MVKFENAGRDIRTQYVLSPRAFYIPTVRIGNEIHKRPADDIQSSHQARSRKESKLVCDENLHHNQAGVGE
jgi:hypothetical protein